MTYALLRPPRPPQRPASAAERGGIAASPRNPGLSRPLPAREKHDMKLLARHPSGSCPYLHRMGWRHEENANSPCARRMNKSVNHLKHSFSGTGHRCAGDAHRLGMRRISNRARAQSPPLQKRCFMRAAPCYMTNMAGTIPAIRGYEGKRSVHKHPRKAPGGGQPPHRQDQPVRPALNGPTGIVRLSSCVGYQGFHHGVLRENSAPYGQPLTHCAH